MEKRKILITTSNMLLYQALEGPLSLNYEVLHAKQDVLAIAVIASIRPWALLVDCQQQSMDGAALCQVLADRLGASTCHILLLEGAAPDTEAELARPPANSPIDAIIRAPTPPINLLLEWLRERTQVQAKPTRRRSHEHRNRPNKYRSSENKAQVIPAAPSLMRSSSSDSSSSNNEATDMTWKELLRSDLDSQTIRAVLAKDINVGPSSVDDIADVDSLSLKQVLNMRVSRNNLKSVLKRLKGDKGNLSE